MIKRLLKRRSWKDRARMIEAYHLAQMITNNGKQSIRHTAKDLEWSPSAISEYLRVSFALRVFPEVDNFDSIDDVLMWLKLKNKCQRYPCSKWSTRQVTDILDTLKSEIECA